MAITACPVHHVTLTVTDVARSDEFYTAVLGQPCRHVRTAHDPVRTATSCSC